MKKSIGAVLLASVLLGGCGGSGNWEASIPGSVPFSPGQASAITLEIKENGQPVQGLNVKADLAMKKMDHGTIPVQLTDSGNGVYKGAAQLSMAGDWVANVTMTDGKKTKEQELSFKAEKTEANPPAQTSQQTTSPEQTAPQDPNTVASINGEPVTKEDLAFHELSNLLQIAVNREQDRQKYTGLELETQMKYWDSQEQTAKDRNTLLTQIIRLRAVALLAKEKGFAASGADVDREVSRLREVYGSNQSAQGMIKQFGQDKFWQKQLAVAELLVLSQKVQQDITANVKKANPQAEQKEVNLLAQKKYEELVVSQMGTLKIQIFNV